MGKLAKYLNEHVVGNVFDRPSILRPFAHDRSILQATPRMVALPETTDDIRKLVRFANQLALRSFRLPITVRGNGTDKTGAAIGEGLIISMKKFDRIEEIDVRGRLVRAQPGVTLGELNKALRLHGLYLPIDYDELATIGGLIANCPNDDAAMRHGGIYHYVEKAEVVLSSGDLVQFAPYSQNAILTRIPASSFEGALYRRIEEVLDQHGDTIAERSMRPFDAAGYANITRVRERHTTNLLPLLFAAQGTLGIVTDVILRVEVMPPAERRLALALSDPKALLRVLNFIADLEPRTLKFYDLRIIQAAAESGNWPRLIPPEVRDGWLVLVSFDDRKWRAGKKVQHCLEILPPDAFAIEETPEISSDFQEFETALVSFLNDNQNGERAAVADDVYVPSYRLLDFYNGLKLVEETLDLELPVFGSFATSNYNVRPLVDCTSMEGRRKIIAFLQQYSRLVKNCEGSLTGGSPEGRVKALSVAQTFSEAERALYNDIKDAFDPNHIFNPSVKLGAELRNTIRHLRTTEPEGIITP